MFSKTYNVVLQIRRGNLTAGGVLLHQANASTPKLAVVMVTHGYENHFVEHLLKYLFWNRLTTKKMELIGHHFLLLLSFRANKRRFAKGQSSIGKARYNRKSNQASAACTCKAHNA